MQKGRKKWIFASVLYLVNHQLRVAIINKLYDTEVAHRYSYNPRQILIRMSTFIMPYSHTIPVLTYTYILSMCILFIDCLETVPAWQKIANAGDERHNQGQDYNCNSAFPALASNYNVSCELAYQLEGQCSEHITFGMQVMQVVPN